MPGPEDFTPEELQVLRPLFLTSSREHLRDFDRALEILGGDPRDEGALESLHRSIHSVKGAALQLGILSIGSLAKAMEAVAKAVRQAGRALREDAARLLAESRQVLGAGLDAFERGEEVPVPPAGLLARLDSAAAAAASAPDSAGGGERGAMGG